jgi:hypothetical protein
MKAATEQIERRRTRHHKALKVLAREVNCPRDGKTLWRKLNRIEREVYAVCVRYSNGATDAASWDKTKDWARAEIVKTFGGAVPHGVFVNGDPRGHMLKLNCDEREIPEGMERDWGGNGILAAIIEDNE